MIPVYQVIAIVGGGVLDAPLFRGDCHGHKCPRNDR